MARRFSSHILICVLLLSVTAGSARAGASASSPEASSPPPADQPKTKKETSANASPPTDEGKPKVPNEPSTTSEGLIAAALQAGSISYEASLRQRAFALFNDPRLEAEFRSPVIDWEAGRALFAEIEEKAATLSKELLADLAPFRARPNDAISVFNQRRSDKTGALQHSDSSWVRRVASGNPSPPGCYSVTKLAERWESRLVRGTNARIWIQGSQQELNKYESMVGKVWRAMPDYFTHPLPDKGTVCDETNPDTAVDVYLVIGNTVDPRKIGCAADMAVCTVRGLEAGGVAWPTESSVRSRYSGYVLVDIDTLDDVFVLDTIAHELTHAAQFAYDAFEGSWLSEGTATWVAYNVVKALRKVPSEEYGLLESVQARGLLPVVKNLHRRVDMFTNRYGAWLFFYSASIDLGDNIVKDVWEQARAPGVNDIQAVDKAIPLQEHFPRYAVRSWNQDLTPQSWPYRTKDIAFPRGLKPDPITPVKFLTASIQTLNQPVDPLAVRYHRATFANGIRKVTFENFFSNIPYAHVWAVKKIGNDWKEPEDWSKEEQKIFCRDLADENLTELIIVVSNTHRQFPLPPDPAPRIIGDSVGCEYIAGWAQASLRVKEGDNDVSYTSSRTKLKFKPRASPLQNQPGDTQYDLMPTAVMWTASGHEGDCKIDGQITIAIPSFENQPLDMIALQPAYGYLNVVGLDGGDFHSVKVSATNRNAFFKKTCPGDPPTVTKYYSGVAWLLLILSEKNTYEGPTVVFKGTKTVDLAGSMGFMSMLPPGTVLPDIALQALRQQGATSNKSEVYTWNWELRPLNFGQTSGN